MKHLRILTCLLAALLLLALTGCDRGSASAEAIPDSAATITITEAEYDEDGNLVSTTQVPQTITDVEYDEDGNQIFTSQAPETVTDAEYADSTEE